MFETIKSHLRHYFLPHESNNYRARLLHHSYLLFYIVLLFLLQNFFVLARQINPNILGYATDITINRIFDLVNQERTKANIPPLTMSEELSHAAAQKATDMFAKNYWAHISPTGTTPWKFITDSGYQYIYAGENLAKNFDKSDEVVKAWMNSPTHRANLLKKGYSEIGLAVINGSLNGEETTLVVQEFGTRVLAAKPQLTTPGTNQEIQVAAGLIPVQSQPRDINPPVSKPIFLPFHINKTMSLVVAEFLLVILFIDSIFILKHKTVRIAGHNLAHIMFILALLGAMGATGIGVIL